MDPYLGEIRMFAGNYAPDGWHFCDGSLLSVSEYAALYSLIGTAYGGNGSTTFGLPNMQQNAPMSMGAGPGLTSRSLGASGGSASVTLTMANMPAHTHPIYATSGPGTTTTPGANVMFASLATPYIFYNDITKPLQSTAADYSTQAISSYGANLPAPHANMMSSMVINFIIAMTGIYAPKP